MWLGIVGNHLVDPNVLPPPLYIQSATQEIRENRGILNRVRLSWTRRIEASIVNDATMAGILTNFFHVSFYTFTHNYSHFTLLFKPLLFSEQVVGTIL
jgi:hypothetical protein